jgi:hypothetical protein
LQKPKLWGLDHPFSWVFKADLGVESPASFKAAYAAFCIRPCVNGYCQSLGVTDLQYFFAGSMTVGRKVAGIKNQKGRLRRFLAISEGAGSEGTLTRITATPLPPWMSRQG